MTISLFRPAFEDVGRNIRALAPKLAFIAGASGDLPIRQITDVQRGLLDCKAAAYEAVSEAQNAMAAAEAYMADMGGPASMVEFQAVMTDIETKSTAWNDLLEATLTAQGGMLRMAAVSQNGVSVRVPEFVSALPAAVANPLRTSPELAELSAIFQTWG